MSNPTKTIQPSIPDYLAPHITDEPFTQHILHNVTPHLSTPVYNHSMRVFLLAIRINAQDLTSSPTFKTPSLANKPNTISHEYLFAASMYHDMGTSHAHNGPQRFEVEGADAAVAMLAQSPYNDEQQMQNVWTAIALHDTAGIAERIDPMTSLLRRAVKADFDRATRDARGLAEYAAEIEAVLPRLDVERVLAGEVVAQATRGEVEKGLYVADGSGRWTDSVKFPKASWPGVLLRGHLEKVRDEGEHWQGANPAF